MTGLHVKGKNELSVEEIFAAAYILYTRYYNPYQNKDADIFESINEIIAQRNLFSK